MEDQLVQFSGLTDEQVLESRKNNGSNALAFKQKNSLWRALKSLAQEPMVLLLLLTSTLYFISGNTGDGIFLASAIVFVATISLYQDSRSRTALEKLETFTQPRAKVIRNGQTIPMPADELVLGDYLLAEEGTSVPADARVVQAHDCTINESILTGESLPVPKNSEANTNEIFRGTQVVSGMAIAIITAIGGQTRLGRIGKSLDEIQEEKTPLEAQISQFVKRMILFGAAVFLVVWGINYFRTYEFLNSLLQALTLAMSILPEEIPVAFTTFMALGAWRLMKMGVVVKQMKTVETLGSATVICTDKTGTITENKMTLARIYVHKTAHFIEPGELGTTEAQELLALAMWASEPLPFDPMEIALHEAYAQHAPQDLRNNYHLAHEYPLSGKPPFMTHVFRPANGPAIIAAKGAPEALMAVSNLPDSEKNQIEQALHSLTSEGFRVLGVGEVSQEPAVFPESQQELTFTFAGLVAFYDPPKKNISNVFEQFYAAGIDVKIVTGDNAATTAAIARQVGFRGAEHALTGDELMTLSEEELRSRVGPTKLFTRMFPEAKLRIIQALKANQEIVAMTGDGVNDGPALKAAHIGIAMGKKGTEIAKQAASLILIEDDLADMLLAIAMGRKIYTNLKKAIQYIISIHIPIILTVFIPLVLGWIYPAIFSPAHIIFLELIMGPTCSIIYENEPMEKNTLLQKPRPPSQTFFNYQELTTSIFQGLCITAGTLLIYQLAVAQNMGETQTRTMVFATLIVSNITLTLVNRSFFYSLLTTLRYKNNLVWYMISLTLCLLFLLIYTPPLAKFFNFAPLTVSKVVSCFVVGTASVLWYELVKLYTRKKTTSDSQSNGSPNCAFLAKRA
ncbi:cation-translocating P-type ATPase [Arundinibacter roseus]|uniref:Cation-translocating P-type ATPase n=1 Tax=Arundinibacter roseus TaxID=2070510 RepID=A0A4R4KIU8_9BACT|nr:cation-translocating P-type ATPase [Arundinibacter roseus]TDB68108.1 cation-translocating P-type ATPase [Arundinibacter roseus]